MQLTDILLTIAMVPVFFGILIATVKPFSDILNERQQMEYNLNRDEFLSASFQKWCENLKNEYIRSEQNTKNSFTEYFDEWAKDVQKLYPLETLTIKKLYPENPFYYKAIWICNGKEREVISKIGEKQ